MKETPVIEVAAERHAGLKILKKLADAAENGFEQSSLLQNRGRVGRSQQIAHGTNLFSVDTKPPRDAFLASFEQLRVLVI